MTRSKRKTGPKTKLTPEVEETILRHLRLGGYRTHAAMAAGIGERTFHEWMTRGEAGEKPFASFYTKIQKALAEDALRCQAVITRASIAPIAGDWRAACYSLERKHPKEYGHAAMVAATRVSIQPSGGSADAGEVARVEFYLPINGRRPDDGDA
jgi:hypothetical protein